MWLTAQRDTVRHGGQTWWQERKTAGHMVTTVRKQKANRKGCVIKPQGPPTVVGEGYSFVPSCPDAK